MAISRNEDNAAPAIDVVVDFIDNQPRSADFRFGCL